MSWKSFELSSCLHRTSMIIKHFIIQLMHNIQYVDTIKIIKYLKVVSNCIYMFIYLHISEECHPRCVFKLYGAVNSVKNTTINIWLNDGVY